MKLMNSLLIVTLAGATALAQTPAQNPAVGLAHNAAQAAAHPSAPATSPATKPSTPATTAAKAPASTQAKSPAAAPAKAPTVTPAKAPATAAKTPAKVPAAAAKTPAKVPAPKEKAASAEKKSTPFAPKKVEAKKAATEKVAKPASAKEEQTASRISATHTASKRDPFVSPIVRASGGGPVCETGKRCLVVDQIVLRGIVKSPSGYIAVVENAAKRAYFLRENDPVFNGSVVKITGDTVVFREQTMDKLGKQGTREVVKKVNAPVV